MKATLRRDGQRRYSVRETFHLGFEDIAAVIAYRLVVFGIEIPPSKERVMESWTTFLTRSFTTCESNLRRCFGIWRPSWEIRRKDTKKPQSKRNCTMSDTRKIVLEETGERRLPTGNENYLLENDPEKLVYNAEDARPDDWVVGPENCVILRVAQNDFA